jgi:hypothetical protein
LSSAIRVSIRPNWRTTCVWNFAELRVRLGESAVDVRFEPGVVQLVQFTELAAAGGIHLVQPVCQFVDDIVSERLVEPSRQRGSDRHGVSIGP